MIYITGDTHIPVDIDKLSEKNFAEQLNLDKSDFVLICGDFGGIWDNSDKEKEWLKWLEERPFTTLFIDGNHENFDLLNKYKISRWCGGYVHKINESIIHLMRGQVYKINGVRIFTLGGAESIDKINRIEGKNWWSAEIPNNVEYEEALDNLDNCKWEVDYVITHTCHTDVLKDKIFIRESNSSLNSFLGVLENDLKYKHWYFGHFHDDIIFEDNKHTLVYNKIYQIKA